MKLHIILRTHSESSVHPEVRFIPVSKQELILQCLKSLILSINKAEHINDIYLTVVDDHSNDACVAEIKEALTYATCNHEFVALPGRGNNASMKFCYEYGKHSDADVLYFVEDDYLHMLSCISEMMNMYANFKSKISGDTGLDAEIAIMPVDNSFHYYDNRISPTPIVLGHKRHWRINTYTHWTVMLSKKALIDNWKQFWLFSDYEKDTPSTYESATICSVYKNKVTLFTPLPTLAIHVAEKCYEAPFSDWKQMWHDVTIAWDQLLHSKTKQKKLVLTIAMGEYYKAMGAITHQLLQNYAQKIGADFKVITEQKVSETTPHWEKFQIHDFLNEYERIIYFDTDLIIRGDCPDLFAVVPENMLGAFNEISYSGRGLDTMRDIAEKYGVDVIDTGRGYFNTGVLVISRQHQGAFIKPNSEITHFYEQSYLNLAFAMNSITMHELDEKFNCMDHKKGLGAYVMHYAGYTDPDPQHVYDFIQKDITHWRAMGLV
ncbi:MAG: glycosyltransferase [bacterium]|nr:glycosyltransferase [bacterium]